VGTHAAGRHRPRRTRNIRYVNQETFEHDLTEAASILARHFPEVAPRLLADHVPDARGRCRGCPSNNHPAPKSPCGLRVLAQLTLALRRR
jgi:hypothetical protein